MLISFCYFSLLSIIYHIIGEQRFAITAHVAMFLIHTTCAAID